MKLSVDDVRFSTQTPSFPRRQESNFHHVHNAALFWIPASARVTAFRGWGRFTQ